MDVVTGVMDTVSMVQSDVYVAPGSFRSSDPYTRGLQLLQHGSAGRSRSGRSADEDEPTEGTDFSRLSQAEQDQLLASAADGRDSKRLRRLLRNRVSAQTTRERRKMEVETLQARVQEQDFQMMDLKARLKQLEGDNAALRRLLLTMQPSAQPDRPGSNPAATPATDTVLQQQPPAGGSGNSPNAAESGQERERKRQRLLQLVQQRSGEAAPARGAPTTQPTTQQPPQQQQQQPHSAPAAVAAGEQLVPLAAAGAPHTAGAASGPVANSLGGTPASPPPSIWAYAAPPTAAAPAPAGMASPHPSTVMGINMPAQLPGYPVPGAAPTPVQGNTGLAAPAAAVQPTMPAVGPLLVPAQQPQPQAQAQPQQQQQPAAALVGRAAHQLPGQQQHQQQQRMTRLVLCQPGPAAAHAPLVLDPEVRKACTLVMLAKQRLAQQQSRVAGSSRACLEPANMAGLQDELLQLLQQQPQQQQQQLLLHAAQAARADLPAAVADLQQLLAGSSAAPRLGGAAAQASSRPALQLCGPHQVRLGFSTDGLLPAADGGMQRHLEALVEQELALTSRLHALPTGPSSVRPQPQIQLQCPAPPSPRPAQLQPQPQQSPQLPEQLRAVLQRVRDGREHILLRLRANGQHDLADRLQSLLLATQQQQQQEWLLQMQQALGDVLGPVEHVVPAGAVAVPQQPAAAVPPPLDGAAIESLMAAHKLVHGGAALGSGLPPADEQPAGVVPDVLGGRPFGSGSQDHIAELWAAVGTD